FFQAEDGIRYFHVTGVQTCALPISGGAGGSGGVGFDDDDGGIAENAGGDFGDIFVGAGDGGTADGIGAAILGNVGIVGRGGALGAAIGRLFGTESAGDFAGTRRRIMKFWGRKIGRAHV